MFAPLARQLSSGYANRGLKPLNRIFRYYMISRINLGIILLLVFTAFQLEAQQGSVAGDPQVLPIRIVDGDTLPNVTLQRVVVFTPRRFKNRWQYHQHQRLIRNLKIVYPYAQIAKNRIAEMDAHFKTLKTQRERDRYVKQVEKELRAEFEEQLVKLTITQGRLLIKLIDREVGRTSFDIIRELRGGFSAVFWQAIARVFGSNLKTQFDYQGDDRILNELIILHEQGLL